MSALLLSWDTVSMEVMLGGALLGSEVIPRDRHLHTANNWWIPAQEQLADQISILQCHYVAMIWSQIDHE